MVDIESHNSNALFRVATLGDIVEVDRLLELGHVAQIDGTNETPIYYALSNEHYDVAKVLVEKGGYDVNYMGNRLDSLLMYAVLNYKLNKAELLINLGADVNKVNGDGSTILIKFLTYKLSWRPLLGSDGLDDDILSIVNLLVERGANVNAVDEHKQSALIYATKYGCFPVVKYLLEKGADINLKGIYHKSALDYAKDSGYNDI